jgi:cyclic pyranopterin phosphate synthase
VGYDAAVTVDRLGRSLASLRLSVTDRCNLRCSYCMPEPDYRWLPRAELLDFEELTRLTACFCAAGVDRVRLTGGEPLLRRDLAVLVCALRALPGVRELALTTNGLLLAEQAAGLRQAGLDRVTVSLDTLRADRFAALTRRDALASVLTGIEAARAAGLGAGLKIDAVVLRGLNDDEIVPLLDYGRSVGAEVRFIEYMDVGGATGWKPEAVVSRAEILAAVERARGPVRPHGERGAAPAERFELDDGTTFGIIASTTAPFCRTCDRSRVTADGVWYHCLYAARGIDLKQHLRSGIDDDALRAVITSGWSARADRGAELRAGMTERGALVPVEALRRDPHLEMHTRGG